VKAASNRKTLLPVKNGQMTSEDLINILLTVWTFILL